MAATSANSRRSSASQKEPYHNELSMDLLGLGCINPWIMHDSSSRLAMFTGHVGSCLSVAGRTRRRCTTGMDREYGKYTFSIKMPVNASIVRTIERYPKRPGAGYIAENPQTIVIYEDEATKQIGCLELKNFFSIHQHFGFNYVEKEAMNNLYRGNSIRAGTILKDSPNVDDNGDYMIGIETEVAFLSIPAVIEDGVVISESYAKKLTTKAYGTRVIKWGKNHYPLNLYGSPNDPNSYKPFPDIGEYIRPDGLLVALRQHHDVRSIVEMTRDSLREPDYFFDKLTYGEANAKVTDIKVYYDKRGKNITPLGMDDQAQKYARADTQFYNALLDEYNRLKAARKEHLHIAPEFKNLLVKAYADSGAVQGQPVTLTHRMVPLDEYRIEITFEYDLVPTIGFKITDGHGGKGVIVGVWPDEDMPTDRAGNRADVIMDPISTIKRMNIGRMYEQYINACSRDTSCRLREMAGLDRVSPDKEEVKRVISDLSLVQQLFDYLIEYYQSVSPGMMDALLADDYREWVRKYEQKRIKQEGYGLLQAEEPRTVEQVHVESVLLEGIYLWLPTNNPVPSKEIVRQLQQKFPPVHGPITYRGSSGRLVTTKKDVLIGSIYVILLDKTGTDYAGVSSAKLQHFGTPAKLTNNDKYAAPVRLQPVRWPGESEGRSFAATIGGDAISDILDQSNNPQVHKFISHNLITKENPNGIDYIVDRDKLPRGNGRPLVFVKHQLECGGWRLVRRAE